MLPEKILKKSAFYYTIAIFLVSVLPINGTNSHLNNIYLVNIRLDYLFHAAIYIPWIVLVWLVIRLNLRPTPLKIIGWIVFSLLFAASLELVQYLLPYRTYNINDLLSNVLGVVIGFIFVVLFSFIFKARIENG